MPQSEQINYRHKTFYTTIDEWWHNVEHEKINNKISKLIAKSTCLIISAYTVGTLLLLYRSHVVDLPFSPISIVQCAILTVYSALITGSFVIIEYIIIDLVPLRLRQENEKILDKIKWCLTLFSLLIVLVILILSLFLNGLLEALVILLTYYVVGIGVSRIWKGRNTFLFRVIWLAFGCIIFVVLLPTNLGGFRVRQVGYCVYSNQTCQEYDYYGISEGLYQFVEDKDGEKHVVLAPVDSGYIRYEQEKSKLFGLIEL